MHTPKIIIAERTSQKKLFKGDVYKFRGYDYAPISSYTRRFLDLKLSIQLTNCSFLSAVKTVFPPTCNRFFFWPLSAIFALSFRYSLIRFSSTPNLLAAPLLLSPSAHATTFNLKVIIFSYLHFLAHPLSSTDLSRSDFEYAWRHAHKVLFIAAAFSRLKDDIRAAFI